MAVSYTHLQKPTIETLKDEFIVGHLMGGPSRKEILKQQPKIDILWDYHTPVSYTHLDVYKRQIMRSCLKM